MRTRRSWLQRLSACFVTEHIEADGTRVIMALDPSGHLQLGPWIVVTVFEPDAEPAPTEPADREGRLVA